MLVSDPQDPNIWCEARSWEGNGAARDLTASIINNLKGKYQDLQVLSDRQLARQPDIHGQDRLPGPGVGQGLVILSATTDRRQFFTRTYAAPAIVYEQAKLQLIPILLNLQATQRITQDTQDTTRQVIGAGQQIGRAGP